MHHLVVAGEIALSLGPAAAVGLGTVIERLRGPTAGESSTEALHDVGYLGLSACAANEPLLEIRGGVEVVAVGERGDGSSHALARRRDRARLRFGDALDHRPHRLESRNELSGEVPQQFLIESRLARAAA